LITDLHEHVSLDWSLPLNFYVSATSEAHIANEVSSLVNVEAEAQMPASVPLFILARGRDHKVIKHLNFAGLGVWHSILYRAKESKAVIGLSVAILKTLWRDQ